MTTPKKDDKEQDPSATDQSQDQGQSVRNDDRYDGRFGDREITGSTSSAGGKVVWRFKDGSQETWWRDSSDPRLFHSNQPTQSARGSQDTACLLYTSPSPRDS